MKFHALLCSALLTLLFPPVIFAGEVQSHAPIGVMGDHRHDAGEWMVSYRYMHMDMPDNYTGTTKRSASEVNNDFMIAPIKMTMEMHMLGLMYGVNDDITAMVMVPYVKKDMDHRRRTDGRIFATHSQGIGDVQVSGLFSLEGLTGQPFHLNMGVSLPSGSINEKGDTLAGVEQDLPYPMQLGSGTYDFHPGLTYANLHDQWSWGAQALTKLRFGKNEHKYRLGNVYEMTSWIMREWNDEISTSFRIKGSIWGNIAGADPRINPAMVPTADANLRGGERIDILLGINILANEGAISGHRLAFEIGYPVYRNLKGPQLSAALQGTVGWQLAI